MSALLQFWLSHRAELAGLIGQHVLLVGASTALAVAKCCFRCWKRGSVLPPLTSRLSDEIL